MTERKKVKLEQIPQQSLRSMEAEGMSPVSRLFRVTKKEQNDLRYRLNNLDMEDHYLNDNEEKEKNDINIQKKDTCKHDTSYLDKWKNDLKYKTVQNKQDIKLMNANHENSLKFDYKFPEINVKLIDGINRVTCEPNQLSINTSKQSKEHTPPPSLNSQTRISSKMLKEEQIKLNQNEDMSSRVLNQSQIDSLPKETNQNPKSIYFALNEEEGLHKLQSSKQNEAKQRVSFGLPLQKSLTYFQRRKSPLLLLLNEDDNSYEQIETSLRSPQQSQNLNESQKKLIDINKKSLGCLKMTQSPPINNVDSSLKGINISQKQSLIKYIENPMKSTYMSNQSPSKSIDQSHKQQDHDYNKNDFYIKFIQSQTESPPIHISQKQIEDVQNQSESPKNQSESPKKSIENVQNHTESPKKSIDKVQNQINPLLQSVEYVQNHSESMAKSIEYLQNHTESPTKSIDKVQNHRESPKKSIEKVQNHRESPTKLIVKVENHSEQLMKSIDMVQNQSESPMKSVDKFQNYSESPMKSVDKVQNHCESPLKSVDKVQNHYESPIKSMQASQKERSFTWRESEIEQIEQKGNERNRKEEDEEQRQKEREDLEYKKEEIKNIFLERVLSCITRDGRKGGVYFKEQKVAKIDENCTKIDYNQTFESMQREVNKKIANDLVINRVQRACSEMKSKASEAFQEEITHFSNHTLTNFKVLMQTFKKANKILDYEIIQRKLIHIINEPRGIKKQAQQQQFFSPDNIIKQEKIQFKKMESLLLQNYSELKKEIQELVNALELLRTNNHRLSTGLLSLNHSIRKITFKEKEEEAERIAEKKQKLAQSLKMKQTSFRIKLKDNNSLEEDTQVQSKSEYYIQIVILYSEGINTKKMIFLIIDESQQLIFTSNCL